MARPLDHITHMEIFDIYVNDAQLHRVIEDIEKKTLTFEADLPILERRRRAGASVIGF